VNHVGDAVVLPKLGSLEHGFLLLSGHLLRLDAMNITLDGKLTVIFLIASK